VSGAVTLPIDHNTNGTADPFELLETKSEAVEMVATGKYPSPPARPLYLVTNGKPTDLVQAFIQWVLTDGQKYIDEVGYIQLAKDMLEAAQAKIK
jgi:phosphate transport system substrate-binding protein